MLNNYSRIYVVLMCEENDTNNPFCGILFK